MLRLVVRQLAWGPDGNRRLQMHNPRSLQKKESGDCKEDWFDHSLRSDGPERRAYEPFIYRLRFLLDSLIPHLEIVQRAVTA